MGWDEVIQFLLIEAPIITGKRYMGPGPPSSLLIIVGMNQFGEVILNSILLGGLEDIYHVTDML